MKDLGQCSEKMFSNWHSYQCDQKAVVEREGKPYCTIHDPDYRMQKHEEREAKRKEKQCQKCSGELKQWWSYCPHCGTKK